MVRVPTEGEDNDELGVDEGGVEEGAEPGFCDLRLKELKGKSRALFNFSKAERGKSRARDAVSVLANLLISCRC